MISWWQGNLVAQWTVVCALVLASCSSENSPATTSVQGRLGAAAGPARSSQQLLTGSGPVGAAKQSLVVDSPETSLDGITLTLVEWRGEPEWHEVGVVDTVTPDSAGEFLFAAVPLMSHIPPGHGEFFVNIMQPEDALVRYGAGGSFRWLRETDTLSLSLPLVTRLQLPLWVDPGNAPPPEQGFTQVQLAVDGSRLVYFTPHRGFGIYDPTGGTVDVLQATRALDFDRADSYVHVITPAGQLLFSLVHGRRPARFVLVDSDIFAEPTVSELRDFDDPTTAAELADRVTIIDVPADSASPEPPLRIFSDAALRPQSVTTADQSRFYLATRGSTFVVDLQSRSVVEAWHDGGHLGAYNAPNGQLFFDMPGAILRVRDAATGALLKDIDLDARFLLGIVALPDRPQTIVSYESAATPLQHRIAVIGANGTVEDDQLAGDYLGFKERLWDPAYAWETCGPEFYQGVECPECPPPPTDVQFPEGIEALHNVDMFFDAVHQRLVMPHFGAAFELRDDVFYPTPFLMCSRFGMPDVCTGQAYHDELNQVAMVQSLSDPSTTCLMHTDGSDLTIPVNIEGGHSGFSSPVVLPQLGIGFVATDQALTAIHYNNAEAASRPAVRDLRGEID